MAPPIRVAKGNSPSGGRKKDEWARSPRAAPKKGGKESSVAA